MRQLATWFLVSGLIIVAFAIDVVVAPNHYVPRVLFGIPIFAAAYLWSVRRTIVVAGIALAAFTVASLLVGNDPVRSGVGVATVFTLGVLGVGFSVVRSRERSYQAQLHQRDQDLVLEQARVRAALSASRVAVFMQDRDLRCFWVGNVNWVSPSDVLGKTDYEMFPPEIAELQASLKRRVMRDGVGLRQSVDMMIAGQVRHLEVSIEPLRGTNDEILGVTVGAADVSEIKRLLDAEQAARQDAEESRARLEQFASATAHDLRQPLTTILGTIQLLRRNRAFTAEMQSTYLDRIDESARRMNRLLSDFHDAGTLGSAGYLLSPRATDLVQIINSVVTEVASAESAYQVHVTTPAELIGKWDPDRITQLLTNLVDNAIKYSPPEGRISIVARQDGDSCHCEVSDEGPGIPAEERERVFEAFHRLAATSHIFGTGLGLFICSRIVAAHGGKIWVDSGHTGPGTTVTFRLPMSSEPAVDRSKLS